MNRRIREVDSHVGDALLAHDYQGGYRMRLEPFAPAPIVLLDPPYVSVELAEVEVGCPPGRMALP